MPGWVRRFGVNVATCVMDERLRAAMMLVSSLLVWLWMMLMLML
jgi:hypothetical protein